MATSRHGRSDSSDTSSSGSAYQLILDHILKYSGSYEIPLRTMYTLNCAPRAQPPHGHPGSQSSSSGSSPLLPQGPFQDDKTTQAFTENVMAQLQQLPNQPTSLPPNFITSFVHRCFPPELVQVDFPQALTGLDYLKDLETRRRREVAAAMNRLNIDRYALEAESDQSASRDPGVMLWVRSIEEKERKIDSLYTQVYVGLRRWILINELSLHPFNKHNCVAMLNTLYPPAVVTQPTSRLTPAILKNQRDGFFNYIKSVEKHGPRVLQNLMQQGKAIGDDTGWIAVTRTLFMYLQLANSIINECSEIIDEQSVSPRKPSNAKGAKQPRKVDSGVSFNGSDRPSTRSNSITDAPVSPISPVRPKTPSAQSELNRPKTPSGKRQDDIPPRPKTPSGNKHPSALERIARGLKTIGRSRTDVTEMISDDTPPPPPPEKTKSLRKMRSMGAIHDGRNGRKAELAPVPSGDVPAFNADEMKRHRMKYEAGVVSSGIREGKSWSHEI